MIKEFAGARRAEEDESEIYKKLENLLNSSAESLKLFRLSRSIVSYEYDGRAIEISFPSFLILTSISGHNLLLVGSTGSGKTTAARAYGRGVFGSEAYLQISPETDLSKLIDINFGEMKEGTLGNAQKITDYVSAPFVVVDEINRVNPKQLNILQEYLNNGVLNLEGGRRVSVGIQTRSGRYQQKIACINVGGEYTGVLPLDAAVADRFSIRLNLDDYPPTSRDIVSMLESKEVFNAEKIAKMNLTKEIIFLFEKLDEVQISEEAEKYALMLSHLNYCYRSPTGLKSGIKDFSKSICEGCHAAERFGNLCGSVRGVSNRSLIALTDLAKAFAIYRNYIYRDTPLMVEVEDMMAAARFVVSPRELIDEEWVEIQGDSSYTRSLDLLLGYIEEAMQDILSFEASNAFPSNKQEAQEVKDEVLQTYPYAYFSDVEDMKRLFAKYRKKEQVRR
ncbi:MAG: AAA family ATPase [Candidatus Micrarchaeia archaeon]|jgi:MoxR-like ATPase